MLARGTKHLLNETRARLAEIAATRTVYSWEPPGAEEEATQLPIARVESGAELGSDTTVNGGSGSSRRGTSGRSSSSGSSSHLQGRDGGRRDVSAAAATAAADDDAAAAARRREASGAPSRHLPFSAELMLALKHPWSGARLIPMAANVQWFMYDCGDDTSSSSSASGQEGDDSMQQQTTTSGEAGGARMSGLWVKMLHNEREVQFPPCAVHHASDPGAAATGEQHHLAINAYASIHGLHYPCPWDVVKEHYRTMRARMMMMIISHMHA